MSLFNVFYKGDFFKRLSILFFCIGLFNSTNILADSFNSHPFYIGAMGGYGATTWRGLVPSEKNQNPAMCMSAPISVEEGGGMWGVFIGYDFIPNLAIEGSYQEYPDATVNFDELSLFSFYQNGETNFITHTEAFNLLGKISVPIINERVRLYSAAGIAGIHRHDLIKRDKQWMASPTFAAGLNYAFNPHWMGEIGANYIAGFGESQLDPSATFFPFLYAVYVRLAYRF